MNTPNRFLPELCEAVWEEAEGKALGHLPPEINDKIFVYMEEPRRLHPFLFDRNTNRNARYTLYTNIKLVIWRKGDCELNFTRAIIIPPCFGLSHPSLSWYLSLLLVAA